MTTKKGIILMAEGLEIHPFSKSSLEEVLDFCTQNPVRPFYSRTLLKRFITQLASSDNLIFDVFNGPVRVGVSVILDKVTNPSGAANLEIIGWDKNTSSDKMFACIFSNLFLERSIQFSTHESTMPQSDVLKKFDFNFLFHTFEMKKDDVIFPKVQINTDIKFEKLSLQTYDEYYKVLVKSFENNIETNIPPFEEMKETFTHRLKIKPSGTDLLILNGNIVGFCSVVPDESNPINGEVHMLGVLPEARGKGLGTVALSKAISELSNLGCQRCQLNVAAQNQDALSLYKKFGFSIAETYTSYLRSSKN